jgi:hypothetical protein
MSAERVGVWKDVARRPPNAVYHLNAKFVADTDPRKLNLGTGGAAGCRSLRALIRAWLPSAVTQRLSSNRAGAVRALHATLTHPASRCANL